MSVIPRYTKDEIKIMKDHLLTMNLNNECLLSTGSESEKRERLFKHFYPSDNTGPNVNRSASTKYTKTQINCLPVGPLRVALAELGLPFQGLGDGRASLKAALYPPPVVMGSQPSGASGSAKYVSASQPNLSHIVPNQFNLLSSQPSGASGASGSAKYVSESQPNLSHDQAAVGNNIQAKGREQWLLLSQTSGPVYTRIPVASRNKASYVYSTLINKLIKANKNDDESAWKKYFGFSRSGLGSSKRGGTKHTSQATLINKRLDAFVSGSMVAEPPPKKNTKKKSSNPSQTSFASRVSAKLSMGDVRGAVTVVTSRKSILPPSQETKEMLQAKNPPRKRSENTRAPIPDFNGNLSHFWVSKEDIRSGIRSFKKGASGGPDGLRPQHLLRGAIWGKTGKT